MQSRVHLVVGGQSSGKSAWAEAQVLSITPDWIRPVIVCPCEPFDDGMRDRIAAHQANRDPRWETRETFDLAGVFAHLDPDVPVLVDALDTWLSQRAYDLGIDQPDPEALASNTTALIEEAAAFSEAAKGRLAPTYIIAGVPGVGLVPLGAQARRLVDLHGKITQALEPDQVTWVHAGRVIAQG